MKYAEITEQLWLTMGGDTVPTRAEIERAVRKLYRFGTGTRFDGAIEWMPKSAIHPSVWFYKDHRSSSCEDPTFKFRSDATWRNVVRIVAANSARIYYREHSALPLSAIPRIELNMVREVIRRGWMGGKLADTVVVRTREQVAIERYTLKVKRLNARIAAWQTKQKRATTALRKLSKQLKAMQKRKAA